MNQMLFSDFFHRNLPADIEQCIELFSIFGGYYEPIDTDEPIESLLRRHILEPFESHRIPILAPFEENPLYSKLLHAISIGDRRLDSAYRRARIGKAKGAEAFSFLRRNGYLYIEYSRETPPLRVHPKQKFKKVVERHKISHKLRFTTPFLRFWFAFVEPFSKTIREGNFEPFFERFHKHFNAFVGFTFEELCNLYIDEILTSQFQTAIADSGSYWDREVEIDLLSETAEGEIWIGECKWTNHKINRKELWKLEEKWSKIGIAPDKIFLFAKRGFSNELDHLRDDRLYRFRAEELMALTHRG
ncbi:MAG: DUF234 domain-containing protein [Sulfuricurvum sp.]